MNRPNLHRIYRLAVSWLYPNVCPGCEKYIDYNADFCAECAAGMQRYAGNDNVRYADRFTAAYVYEGIAEEAVLKFKRTDCGNSYYAFACGIAEALRAAGFGSDADIIVPIPMTKRSLNARGYNQTELIAKELRYMIKVPYQNVLVKVRETKEQKSLKRSERAENVRNAFGISGNAPDIKGKTLLLIDDLCTTGSTLSEAARVLKENGAGKVYAAAFSKTQKKDRA